MAEQLESLLQKIQEEAVTKADETAKARIGDAEKRAAEIVADAEKRAETIVAEGEQKAEQFSLNGKKSLEQAARDVLICLRQSIDRHFEALIKAAVPELMPIEVIQEILIKLATEAGEKGLSPTGVKIYLSERDHKNLVDFFMHRFHEAVEHGAEFHPLPDLKAGFRICISDKDVQYDYSDEVLVEILSGLVNPVLEDILKKAVEQS